MKNELRPRSLVSLLALSALTACSSNPTAPAQDDPTTSDGRHAADAGADGAVSSGAVPPPPPSDPCNAVPSESSGVFVALMSPSTSTATCGSIAEPCTSVQAAIERAAATGKSTVYVASGLYVESLALKPGITVAGGWSRSTEGAWTKECGANASAFAIVRAPATADTTVTADIPGEATLDTLTIESKQVADPGQSLYGIVARGPATHVGLRSVKVVVAAGGNGAPGAPGAAGITAAGGCTSPSDGVGATTPGAHGVGASAGRFTSAGYAAGSASSGFPGAAGHNGSAGAPPDCVVRIACNLTPDEKACMQPPQADQVRSCGTDGLVGCGGGGGGGAPGQNGGSSVAVLADEALVTVFKGRLEAGKGGDGGAGGSGSPGAPGSNGIEGAAGPPIPGSCTFFLKHLTPGSTLPFCLEGDPVRGGAWGAGRGGGTGSAGGNGGGGAGGFSYASVTLGRGSVTATDAALVHAAGGAGGVSSNAGAAGAGAEHN
jgi:hypothetical protein